MTKQSSLEASGSGGVSSAGLASTVLNISSFSMAFFLVFLREFVISLIRAIILINYNPYLWCHHFVLITNNGFTPGWDSQDKCNWTWQLHQLHQSVCSCFYCMQMILCSLFNRFICICHFKISDDLTLITMTLAYNLV